VRRVHNLSKRADSLWKPQGISSHLLTLRAHLPSVSTASLMSSERLSSTNAGYPQIPSPYYDYDKNVL
jgi:hypothetical protein